MIKEFIDIFMERKKELEKEFKKAHPEDYRSIVKSVIKLINSNDTHGYPDPKRIHEIDDGDYQGTLIYIIPEVGYQPSDYWSVRVSYGSCSGCDTLESIREYSNKLPNKQQVKDYMTLALHIIQGLKKC